MSEPDIAPDGTMMLEPRDMYDKAYLGHVFQGGMTYAVYSAAKCIELIYEETLEELRKDPDPTVLDEGETLEQVAYTQAVEHFDFNVSGSIGVGFPVFQEDREIE
jgi:hypothetical protein